MKKSSFVICLIGSVGIVSSFVPTLVSCNKHEHQWDGYEVIDNQLYKTCSSCGEKQKLTDFELQEHENDFLYSFDGKLVLVNKPKVEDNNTLSQILTTFEGDTVDVYLFGDLYEIDVNRSILLNTNIHGLLDNSNQLISHIDCFNNNITTDDPIYHGYGLNLKFDHVYMDGGNCSKPEEISFYCGIQADGLTCENCTFTGIQSTYTNNVTFKNCFFDSTKNKTSDVDAEYSIYCRGYNVNKVVFIDCQFKDIGKAVKIYSEGQVTDGGVYTFTRCSFECIQDWDMKACIAIDSTFQSTKGYHIIVNQCTNVNDSHIASIESQRTLWKNLVENKGIDNIIVEIKE